MSQPPTQILCCPLRMRGPGTLRAPRGWRRDGGKGHGTACGILAPRGCAVTGRCVRIFREVSGQGLQRRPHGKGHTDEVKDWQELDMCGRLCMGRTDLHRNGRGYFLEDADDSLRVEHRSWDKGRAVARMVAFGEGFSRIPGPAQTSPPKQATHGNHVCLPGLEEQKTSSRVA